MFRELLSRTQPDTDDQDEESLRRGLLDFKKWCSDDRGSSNLHQEVSRAKPNSHLRLHIGRFAHVLPQSTATSGFSEGIADLTLSSGFTLQRKS